MTSCTVSPLDRLGDEFWKRGETSRGSKEYLTALESRPRWSASGKPDRTQRPANAGHGFKSIDHEYASWHEHTQYSTTWSDPEYSREESQDWTSGSTARLAGSSPFEADHALVCVDDEDDEASSFWSPESILSRQYGANISFSRQPLEAGPIDISNECIEDWQAVQRERPDRARAQCWVNEFITLNSDSRRNENDDLVSLANRQPSNSSRWDFDRLFPNSAKVRPMPQDMDDAWALAGNTKTSHDPKRGNQEALRVTARTRLDMFGAHLGQDFGGLVV